MSEADVDELLAGSMLADSDAQMGDYEFGDAEEEEPELVTAFGGPPLAGGPLLVSEGVRRSRQPDQHPTTLHARRREPDTLSADGRDILAGISVMVLAIANRQNLAEQEQQAQDEDELGEPMPCSSRSKDDPALSCIKEVGHSGRHKYRPINAMVS
jgi:hypothetical protein